MLIVDAVLSGIGVVREPDNPVRQRGKPMTVISDNGTEFTSMAISGWSEEKAIEWHLIQPGKPMQNGFVESFNRRFRDEYIDETLLSSLFEARTDITE